MNTTFIPIASAFLLTFIVACGGMSKKEAIEFNEKLKGYTVECEQQKSNGLLQTNMEVAECTNEKVLNAFIEIDYPYMDLVQLYNAYRLAVAEKVDEGEITEAEGNLMMAEIRQKIASEEYNRNYQKSVKWSNAFKEFSNTVSSYQSSTLRTPITCYQTGNVITCQ